MPVFTELNLLQRESPCIHLLREAMERMLRKLLGRFVTVSAMESGCVLSVSFMEESNQLSDREIMVVLLLGKCLSCSGRSTAK